MEELESRLNDSLTRKAAGLPRYDENLPRATQRGRNRRWAARGAGAFGALALLGGGIAIFSANTRPEESNIATEVDGGGEEILAPAPETTPEPTPTPADEPNVVSEGEPPPTPDNTVAEVNGVSLVVATGWGVGLVGGTGEQYAPIVCCDPDAEDAMDAPPTQVRDDLRGGLIAANTHAIYWLPAPDLASGAQPLEIASAPDLDASLDTTILLWDIRDVDDALQVLYSIDSVSADKSEGSSTLYSLDLASPGADPVNEVSITWDAPTAADAAVYRGSAWLPEGGIMTLESAVAGPGCEWISYFGPLSETDTVRRTAQDYTSPYLRPTDPSDCPHDSIGAATTNEAGVLAVTHRFLSPSPELVVHDRAGNELFTYPLTEGDQDQGRWIEIDMVGDQVLVSRRADMTMPNWPTLDETLKIDLQARRGISVFSWGAPTFPRADIATDTLTLLEPADPLWFAGQRSRAQVGPPTPTPTVTPVTTPGVSPAPRPDPTPDPTPQTTPPPTSTIPPEYRTPTGRLQELKPSGILVGDDGCLSGICIGQILEDALIAATSVYGDEDTATSDAALEGQAPPPSDHVFITDTKQVTLVEQDGLIAVIRISPTMDGVDQGIATIGQVLATHGAPTEVFNGGGEGSQVLWLFYDTDAAFVAYGFTEFWGADATFLLDEGDLSIAEAYDDLPVNSYWARPQG